MISEATHDGFVRECNWASLSQSAACNKVVQAAHAEMGSGTPFFNKYNVFVDACQEGGERAHGLKARVSTSVNSGRATDCKYATLF